MRFAWLETERLCMRPFGAGDVDALHALFVLPEVRQYLLDDVVIEREQAAEFVEASERCFDENGFGLCVLLPREMRAGAQNSELIGFCGVRHFEDPYAGEQPELLYGLEPRCWGQGYALEASVGMLRFAFEACRLPLIYAGIDPPNVRSRRVIERLGMSGWRSLEFEDQPADYAQLAAADFAPGAAYYRLIDT